MTALIIGTLIALGAVAFVLVPLFREDHAAPPIDTQSASSRDATDGDDAVGALREIEFDRATGKLSDADYTDLKTRYTARALEAMRVGEGASATSGVPMGEDAAEAAVLAVRRRLRTCARCGPRPEADAVYCSSCGAYLDETCAGCGRAVVEAGASFCAGCGRQLAA